MKKLLNRIENSSSSSGSNIVQLPSSSSLNNNGGGGGGGGGGGLGGGGSGIGDGRSGHGGGASGNSSGGSAQTNVLGKTISLKKVNNISVEEIIAEGGFGIVYLAKANSVKYALKRVIVNNEVDLGVVTREIQIMTTLSHPNLLPCIDFTVTPLGNNVTEALLLMPYYRSTLLNLLNQRMSNKSHLSEKEVLLILLDIVSAIARLHHCTTPIIHRDIKIENVLIDETPTSAPASSAGAAAAPGSNTSSTSSSSSAGGGGAGGGSEVAGNSYKCILCDFGSATAKFWDTNVHSIQTIQDDLEKYTTLAYRAPEMVDLYSNRGTLNTKLDIWALGIFTYKICFYTTPFGDSILAIQSANLSFPATSTYSPSLHALIYYLLTPDSVSRPDIFQAGELVSQMLKIKNPIQNLNGVPSPPSLDVLINNMTTRKMSNSDAVIINKSAGSVVPLETSVTPRQRPKGNTILQAPTNGNILIIPPPKSPCKLVPDPLPLTGNGHSASVAPVGGTTSGSDSDGKGSGSSHHHRRNVSDSSAFEKNQLQQPSDELSSTTSEQALSSWNPFEEHLTATSTSATMSSGAATVDLSNVPNNPVALGSGGTGGPPAMGGGGGGGGIGEDDDPFENAPFECFKYQPIDLSQEDEYELQGVVNDRRFEDTSSPVDLFGAAPFSNPFLEFSLGNGRSDGGHHRHHHHGPSFGSGSDISDTGRRHHNHHHAHHQHQHQNSAASRSTQQQPVKLGVTNLSFED